MGGKLPHELLLAAAEEIIRRGEQVLVFVADREATVDCAKVLADRACMPSLDDAIEELLEQEVAWIVDALSAVAWACGWSDERQRELTALSERLMFGVRPEAVPIARLRVHGLGRVLVRRLLKEGFSEPASLIEAGLELVQQTLKHRRAFDALCKKLGTAAPAAEPSPYPPAGEAAVLAAADPATAAKPPRRKRARTATPPGPSGSTAVTTADAPVLVVDLKNKRVTYRGHEIPTRPPNHLQRFGLLALAVLASRPGDVVSMDDLAAGMSSLAYNPVYLFAPETKNVRHRILYPFKKALAGTIEHQELDCMLETCKGIGIRLTASAKILTA
jgi:hypothetical protein